MKINSIKLIYFSRTRTTESVVLGIAQGIRVDNVERLDFTTPVATDGSYTQNHDELAIIGAPVYGGRIPPEAARRFRRIKVNDMPAVVVVVYGNREYEDALLELSDLTTALGFRPVAGGAFIGEHSYNSEETPMAGGRPDRRDLEKAKSFGELIHQKMIDIHEISKQTALAVPGKYPHREWQSPSGISPASDEKRCTLCETCAIVCPSGAITVKNAVMTNRDMCILCNACVKKCPTGARAWEILWCAAAAKRVSEMCRERKEPEFYL